MTSIYGCHNINSNLKQHIMECNDPGPDEPKWFKARRVTIVYPSGEGSYNKVLDVVVNNKKTTIDGELSVCRDCKTMTVTVFKKHRLESLFDLDKSPEIKVEEDDSRLFDKKYTITFPISYITELRTL